MPDLELLTHVADPTNHAVQVTPGPHPHMPHTVTGTMPDGMIYQPQEDRYRKDPKTGITFGHAACFTPRITGTPTADGFKRKYRLFLFFHFGLARLSWPGTGYTNYLKHDDHIFEPARRHGPAEQKLENDKCSEMLAGGLIEASFSKNFCSNLTFPPKKAADGQWTERRM